MHLCSICCLEFNDPKLDKNTYLLRYICTMWLFRGFSSVKDSIVLDKVLVKRDVAVHFSTREYFKALSL